MKRVIFYIILLLLQINPSCAADGRRIAYSKRYGIEVYAAGSGDKWCGKIIHLKVAVKDAAFFHTPDFPYVFTRIMHEVIDNRECPAAEVAGITASDIKEDKFFKYVAVKNDNWTPREVKNNELGIAIDTESLNDSEAFSVSGWKPQEKNDINVVSDNVYEHVIKDNESQCAIRYVSPKSAERTKNWRISVEEKDTCKDFYINGRAHIRIYNGRNRLVARGFGHFSAGYYTDDIHFPVKFLDRYAYGMENQRLNYLIDTDNINKIYYVGYLRAEYKGKYDKFTKWHGCDPFIVNAVTDNVLLFANDGDIDDTIIDAARDYAATYCPDASEMRVFGTKKPYSVYGVDMPSFDEDDDSWKSNPDFYFGTVMRRNPDSGAWIYDSSETKNRIKHEEVIRQADKMSTYDSLSSEYYSLLKAPFIGKLAYMFNVPQLDNLNAMVLSSKLNGYDSVYISTMLNIAAADGFSSKSFYPIPMVNKCKGKMLCEQGWYLASGYLRAMTDEEKNVHGLSKHDFVASFVPDKTMKCSSSFCSEAKNVLTLVQRRHKGLDLMPQRDGE